jgi:fumarate hydratase class II
MIATQVIGLDVAVALGGGGGHLEMNVYKPLMIHNVMESIRILTDGMNNFRRFLVEGVEANTKQIAMFLERSLMLVTALSPVIGYDEASRVANFASANDTTLREAALVLGVVSAEEFDRLVDPRAMLRPIPDTEATNRTKARTATANGAKRRTPTTKSTKRG